MGIVAIAQYTLKKEIDDYKLDGNFLNGEEYWSSHYLNKSKIDGANSISSTESSHGGMLLELSKPTNIYSLPIIPITNNNIYKSIIRIKTTKNKDAYISVGYVFFDKDKRPIPQKNTATIKRKNGSTYYDVSTSNKNKLIIYSTGTLDKVYHKDKNNKLKEVLNKSNKKNVLVKSLNTISDDATIYENYTVCQNAKLNNDWSTFDVNNIFDKNHIKYVKPVIRVGMVPGEAVLLDCFTFDDVTEMEDIKNSINDIFSDDKVTPNEKLILKREWENIKTEKDPFNSLANKYKITKELNEYNNSYNSLDTLITPILSEMDITTDGSMLDVNNAFISYYKKREALNTTITKAQETELDNKVANTPEDIFNGLTDNGAIQGLISKDGKFYFNGEYVQTKGLKAIRENADGSEITTFEVNSDGNIHMRPKSLVIESDGDLSIKGKITFEAFDNMLNKNIVAKTNSSGQIISTEINGASIKTGSVEAEAIKAYRLSITKREKDSSGEWIDSTIPTFQVTDDGFIRASGTFQSFNYKSDIDIKKSTGWMINENGDSVFNNTIVRGRIEMPDAGMTDADKLPESTLGAPVRIYAGETYERREFAPFKVLQNGTVMAEKGIFSGTFTGELKIGNITITDTDTTSGTIIMKNNSNTSTIIRIGEDYSTFKSDVFIGEQSENSISLSPLTQTITMPSKSKIDLYQKYSEVLTGNGIDYNGISISSKITINGHRVSFNDKFTLSSKDENFDILTSEPNGKVVISSLSSVNGSLVKNDANLEVHGNAKITKSLLLGNIIMKTVENKGIDFFIK